MLWIDEAQSCAGMPGFIRAGCPRTLEFKFDFWTVEHIQTSEANPKRIAKRETPALEILSIETNWQGHDKPQHLSLVLRSQRDGSRRRAAGGTGVGVSVRVSGISSRTRLTTAAGAVLDRLWHGQQPPALAAQEKALTIGMQKASATLFRFCRRPTLIGPRTASPHD